MKGLNFKDWMKISSDKKSTTLQHKNGHIMTIAHGALPKIQQEQLVRLPMSKGGDVKGVHVPDEDDDDEKSGRSPAGAYSRAGEKSEGKDQKKFWNESAKKEHRRVLGEMKDMKKPKLYAEGGEATADEPKDAAPLADAPDPAQAPATTININAAPAPSPSAPAAQAPAPSPLMMPALQNPAPAMTPVAPYTGSGPGQGPAQMEIPQVPAARGSGIQGVLNQEQQGLAQNQKIQEAQGIARASNEDAYLKQKQALIDQNQQAFNEAHAATQRLDAYAQSHPINNNAYFENMNVPSKISSALGLLFGGFTGGFNGTGNNPAMNYLMDQQAKDIQSQKDRMDQQKTVFGAYHQIYNDQVVANNLASVSYNDMLKHQADLVAAKLATPQAQAANAMLSAQLNKENYLKLGAVGQRLSGIKNGQIKPEPVGGNHGPQASSVSPGKASSDQGKESAKSDDPYGYRPDSILTPDATAKFNNLAVTPLMTPEQKSEFSSQYNRAVLADKALKLLPDVMNDMHENATGSGMIQRKLTPHMSGAIGEALGPVVGYAGSLAGGAIAAAQDMMGGEKPMTGATTQANKAYTTAQTKLTDLLTNALKSANIAPSQIQKMVDDLSPEPNDSPEQHLAKVKALEQIIKTNANVGTLEARGATKKVK